MSSDKLIFDLSQEIEGSPNVFVKKDWLNILDNQNQNYNSNQSVLDTSQLANSNKYMSYREGYLSIPLLLTLLGPGAWSGELANASRFTPATAATNADYSLGLKNWFGSIIHSFTLDYNGTTIIQQTPYVGMWNCFKLMTSLSWNDVQTQGSTIGFYPDTPTSWTLYEAAAAAGQGICNNSISPASAIVPAAFTGFNIYNSGRGNAGLANRIQFINYDPAGTPGDAAYSTLFSAANCQSLWKSYISTKVNGVDNANAGVFQISVVGTIMLKHIHSFFAMCPLLKGVFMKMTANLNSSTSQFTSAGAGAALTLVSIQNAVGGVNPLMITSADAGQGNAAVYRAGSFLANVSVGAVCLNSIMNSTAGVVQGQLSRSIYLYIPAYTFNPVFEQAYISSPVKQIQYTDVYQYQVINIGAGQQFNNLLTNGIANIKSVLILPYFCSTTPAVNGINPSTNLPPGIPVFQSPFDPAGAGPTSPLTLLTNFNVVVSGQNSIYNTQRYSFEQFNNQLYGCNSVNGGQTDGLTSALFNSLGFEMEYCYFYVNVSRMLPVEESVPKSVQIIGQNATQNAIDLFCFIEYGVEVDVDILTGARV
jgi:hypothetical protein